MHITGFLQVGNEKQSGHLERFTKWNLSLFDSLATFDDNSNDGTSQIIEALSNVYIKSSFTRFKNEQFMRHELLSEAKKQVPWTDWFLWLDSDEVLLMDRMEIENLIKEAELRNCDSISFPLVNLWKSESYERVDSGFSDLHKVHIWKNKSELQFKNTPGLHKKKMHPDGLTKVFSKHKYKVLHFGFSSEKLILNKFISYSNLGQINQDSWRLIDENNLDLKLVVNNLENLGNRAAIYYEDLKGNANQLVNKPSKSTIYDYYWQARELGWRYNKISISKPIITLISLIYAGVDWLEFQYSELLKLQAEFASGDVEILFVANDASDEVMNFLIQNDIPYVVAPGRSHANEWYINSVYRAYNFGVQNAKGEYVLLTNSDMAYSSGFLTSLYTQASEMKYLCAGLMESGRLKSGDGAVSRNLGKTLRTFNRRKFETISRRLLRQETVSGGLYMPCLINKNRFLELGGYPEGNLTPEGFQTYLSNGQKDYADLGNPCIPGDYAFAQKSSKIGYKHQTYWGSVAYHFQEGEKSTFKSKRNRSVHSGLSIINNQFTGINGEQTLWNYLINDLEASNIGLKPIRIGVDTNKITLLSCKKLYTNPIPRLVFTNATFLRLIRGPFKKMVLVQDKVNGRELRKQNIQRKFSFSQITNTQYFINDGKSTGNSYLLPLPIDELWFEKTVPNTGFLKTGIFVGAFDEIKGWSKVKEFVINHPEIHFNLVSKYEGDNPDLEISQNSNFTLFYCLSNRELLELVDSSDFFILGSPFETQCLEAIEAAARDKAVLMTNTGLLSTVSKKIRVKIGSFEDDLEKGFEMLNKNRHLLAPRQALNSLGLEHHEIRAEWNQILRNELLTTFRTDNLQSTPLKYFIYLYPLSIITSRFYKFYRKYRSKLGKLKRRLLSSS